MKNRNLKIAIVGAGRVAQHYKTIFDSSVVSGFEIVGICDPDKSAREIFTKHWSCIGYDDISKMLSNSLPELVIVLTPSGMHYEHAKTALDFNVHVLVEKPATMNTDDSKRLVELAKKKSLMFGVCFQNRLNPAVRHLAEAVFAKRFGKITTSTIRLRWCRFQEYYDDDWHGTWEKDGGVINQQAIHHVDVLRWLMGPVISVCASMENRINSLEAEDTMVAILRFANGALGTIEATTAARPKDYEASLSIVGENGIAVIGGVALNKIEMWDFIDSNPEDFDVKTKYSFDVPNGYGLSHGPLLQSVIDSLKNGDIIPPISVEESIVTNELIHALYCSIESNGWVDLKSAPISKRLGKRSN